MPRNYEKRRDAKPYQNYSEDNLQKALQAVEKGMSTRKAADKFGVPKTTLNYRIRNQHTSAVGRPTTFTPEQEEKLAKCILLCAEWGFPLMVIDVQLIVQSYLNTKQLKCSRFSQNCPGVDWVKSFLRRHPQLSKRLCQNVKRSRACLDYGVIEDYFSQLSVSLQNVPPSSIVNYDETNFSDDPGQTFVIVRRGTKHAERIVDTSRSSTSVMFAGSADGTLLPPYTVYKSKHLYPGWIEGGVEGSFYNRTDSGWFDMVTFTDWFEKVALPYFRKFEGRKAIIGDNLASHVSPRVISLCEKYDISFILLPPNATHLCQPLDVAVFGPTKKAWRKVLADWKIKHRGPLNKPVFPTLLNNTLDGMKENLAHNIRAGFRATGIYPLDKQKVLRHIPREEQSEEDGQTWSKSVVNHLSEARASLAPVPTNRAKKLQVPAGKSISAQDIGPQPSKKRKNRQETNRQEIEEQECEDLLAEEAIDDPVDNPVLPTPPPVQPDQDVRPESDTSILAPGDFILVSLAALTRRVYYVGQVKEIVSEPFIKVSFLRVNRARIDYFTFPTILDEQVIPKIDVVMKLPFVNDLRRGRFSFPDLNTENVS